MSRHAFALISAAVLLPACQSHSASADAARADLAQWSGQDNGSDLPQTRVLRTADEWDGFWRQVKRERPRSLNTPREMAVVVQLGEKRTGGYGATILGAREEAGKLVVDYRETAPDPGMMVTQALTSPWAIALVPRSELPVVFRNTAAPRTSRHEK